METALIIAQFMITYGVPATRKLIELLRTPNPTWEQWDAVFALSEKPFDEYVNPTPPP